MSIATDVSPALAIDDRAADLLFREGHTAHAFTDQPVSDQELEGIYDLLKMAPTAMNSQPLRITWVRSEEARMDLVAHMNEGNQDESLGAPMTAILSVDTDWHRNIGFTAPHAVGNQPYFEENEAARVGMGTNSAWIQVGYFVLAARAMGLDAGPMTGFDADAINAAFHADSGHKVLAVVNLGHAAAEGIRPRGGRLAFDAATTTV